MISLIDIDIVNSIISILEEHDINLEQTKVGDRYVLEKMREGSYSIGGEQSGHVIFLEHNTTGDGLLTAVQLISVMKKTGFTLSKLASVMTVYPQVLKNAKVHPNKKHFYQDDSTIKQEIEKLEQHFHGNGRVLIRPSGTEPLIRVMIEGQDEEELNKMATNLVNIIENILG